jgi:hypothetical protein
MNFTWNEPKNVAKHPHSKYPKSLWDLLVIAWLNYNNVWPHTDRSHLKVHYNYVYHFFDITIFECHLPGNGHPRSVIENMIKYLSGTNLQWTMHDSFTWDNHNSPERKKRDGVRFLIQAEDFPCRRVPVVEYGPNVTT